MRKYRGNPWAVLIVVSLGFLMTLLDLTIVNIAIPDLITQLHASLDDALWVINAYALVLSVLLITSGRLGDLFGQRRLFNIGIVIFTAASAACGLAPSPGWLIAFRAVQGLGAAVLMPQTLAILTMVFPAERRGAAFGVWGAVAGVATIAGPTLGGLLVTAFDWRWIFYVNLPIGVIVLALSAVIVPDLRTGRKHRLDIPGVILASLALVAICYGLVEGQRYNWGTISGFLSIPLILAAGRLTDKIGGKFILMTGLLLFAGGMAWTIGQATTTSQWYDFLPALAIAGVGIGCVFAPMTTVAMRDVAPQMAGAASGMLNTVRQVGGVIGTAAIGALLQSQLSSALTAEAIRRSAALPPGARAGFVSGFARAAQSGLQVGAGQSGSKLPPGTPPGLAAQLQRISHEVFTQGFVNALHPTIVFPIVVLVLGALSCLFLRGGPVRPTPPAAPAAAQEEQAAPAA
jgi:MFS family permease